MLWQHVVSVSKLAGELAKHEGASRTEVGLATVAGLLHDIGLMVLLENEAARYQPLWQAAVGNETALVSLEREAFGACHGELGAMILSLWGLPGEVVNAVSNSHLPPSGGDAFSELDAASRAVIAAEWLLDGHDRKQLDDLPTGLAIGEATLESWLAVAARLEAAAVGDVA